MKYGLLRPYTTLYSYPLIIVLPGYLVVSISRNTILIDIPFIHVRASYAGTHTYIYPYSGVESSILREYYRRVENE